MTVADLTAALPGAGPAVRGRALLAARVRGALGARSPLFLRALPTTAAFAAAAALLALGALPVVDGELVLAGLGTAVLGTTVAGLIDRTTAAVTGALLVPAAHLAAVALLCAGTGTAATLFLLLGPVLTLVTVPGLRGLPVAVLGTAAALLAPALLTTAPGAPAGLPGALLLGPLAVALGGLVVNDGAGRWTRQTALIHRLSAERASLLAQVQSRADELDLATRMLAARAQTMTSVIDAVTEQSIIGTDCDGVIRVWNPGAERMLGLPRLDVVRKRSIVEFHLPEELAEVAAEAGTAPGLEALVHAAHEHGSDVRDWTYLAADGQPRTVAVAVTPRTDDRGVHAGWNFVGTDMTEARATERMKDQFVSLISHELRTPLSSILGYLELVMDPDSQPLTDEQRQYLTTVERNAQRLLRLVGDLLFTAQVEAGRFTLQPEDVDLCAVVRAAEETSRVAAASAGVEVTVETPPEGLVVPGDPVRLGQACDNLVSNAVKFTPAGGRVSLSLRAAWRTADGELTDDERPGAEPVARLAVCDTGLGIPAGEQAQMFTKFFRASTARRNAVPGVGLGLTITKAITTAHGGHLELESTEGEGTTFTLTLPRQ
jgi:PAS domain S-box-containing protein